MTTRALVPQGIVILLVLTLAVAWLWMLGNSPVHGAATLTVTKTGDTNDGICSLSDCSLREAIASGDSGDTINVPGGIYTLTLGSELTIDKNLTLTGDGSTNSTIIQAAASSADATHRVFTITAGSNVAISGVIIPHGRSLSSIIGGGSIVNRGTLTLTDSKVINKAAVSSYGGGI